MFCETIVVEFRFAIDGTVKTCVTTGGWFVGWVVVAGIATATGVADVTG